MTELRWLNEESETILQRGYLLEGETPMDAITRVVNAATSRLQRPDLTQNFMDLICKGWMSLSSPVWSNMGTERGLPISCFNVHVPDTMEGITDKLGEVIMQTRFGGGTSGYFGEVRGRGVPIRGNGYSTGVVNFLHLFDTTITSVSQGGIRRGSFAAYLDIEHRDIEEYLNIKDVGNQIQNLFYGVCISDEWMESMRDGDKEKRKLWAKVLKSRQMKGLPYLFFTDNVNKNKPEVYKDKDMPIKASNLCVAYDTKILTDAGEVEIHTKVKQWIKVWNGTEYKNAYVDMTGKGVPFLRVTTTRGELECTRQHQWHLEDGSVVTTEELEPGMKLRPWVTPDGETVTDSIEGILDEGVVGNSYCFNEPDTHLGVFNGILTGQCSEIALPSREDESFVCCLASMNLELYDEWKGTSAVQDAVYFLDAVMEEFIAKTDPTCKDMKYMQSARNFAMRHRALGLGVLGLHSLYQSRGIPFDSMDAHFLNTEVFKYISSEALIASKRLAVEYGEPEVLKGYGRRNTTLMAIAPTTSSSAILGQVSPGIEPFSSNYYKAGLAKGNFIRKNKHLKALLQELGKDTPEVWRSIMLDKGSVQNLDFLTQEQKDVFKTFKEINQFAIVNQAAARQKFIDQSQSLNLNIPPEIPIKDVNKLIMTAWETGVKTLYYQRSESASKTIIGELLKCNSCEA